MTEDTRSTLESSSAHTGGKELMHSAAKKYRFLFISVPFGGIEIFMRNLRRPIEERKDIDSTWITIESQPSEVVAHLPIVSSNWTLKAGLVARRRIRQLENAGLHFDAIFVNHTIPLIFMRRFRNRVPVVLSLDTTAFLIGLYSKWYFNGTQHDHRFSEWAKKVLRVGVYSDASFILPWSNLVKRSLMNHYHIGEEKLRLVPPGIDLERWKPSGNPSYRGRSSKAQFRVLFVGGEFERKGGDVLLKVARRREFQSFEFHFVTRAFHGAVPDNVFVYDNLHANCDELIDLYQRAHAFALPTRADFAPTNAICEAMAMGLPVISTNVGGLGETVVHGETGLIVPPDNEESLADALTLLASDEQLCLNMGRNARTRIEQENDIKKTAQTVIDHLVLAADQSRSGVSK